MFVGIEHLTVEEIDELRNKCEARREAKSCGRSPRECARTRVADRGERAGQSP